MHIAQVSSWGNIPKYTSVEDLPAPASERVRIKVLATGVHRVVRSRAAGQHYSAKSLPHTPGIDGVGLANGKKVYFSMFGSGATGALSEYINVAKTDIHLLSDDADAVKVAALVNPALSSWLAMKARTNLPEKFTVLIVGATTASGRLAVQLARELGAERIIGAGRNESAEKELGVDDWIKLEGANTNFDQLGDIDIVLDYVYGPVIEQFFRVVKSQRPIQYVQIGTLGGQSITLPADLLRSNNITIRGSGPGAWSLKECNDHLPDLLKVLGNVDGPTRTAALKDVESEWEKESSDRLVFIP